MPTPVLDAAARHLHDDAQLAAVKRALIDTGVVRAMHLHTDEQIEILAAELLIAAEQVSGQVGR